jgi:radical SAM protein with 4Fe4S-binding SPASM domain
LGPEEIEAVMHFLADVSNFIPLKTTEGHHYKRVVMMRRVLRDLGQSHDKALKLPPLYHLLRRSWEERIAALNMSPRAAARRQPMHINSAQGFVFISHLGHVYPSGFLPLTAGNVRQQGLPEIYRDSPLFQSLRQTSRLKGRCGECEFREICGGSRSRAYALDGDELGEDPSCAYQPGTFPYPSELQQLLQSS